MTNQWEPYVDTCPDCGADYSHLRERFCCDLCTTRVENVPTLDAQTAYELCAFLHWLAVTLQRVHDVKRDPFWCFEDVLNAADASISHFEGRTFRVFEVRR